MLLINQCVPDFHLPATTGTTISLYDFKEENIVLYFYPKDCTAGCSQEAKDFAAHYKKFASLNTVILGVSRDIIALHMKFKTEQQLPFELLSDADEKLCHAFGVIKEKTIYGKKTRGIERSTFLIDKEHILRREWRKVQVAGHVQSVLQAVSELGK